jgi:hypothetical protein
MPGRLIGANGRQRGRGAVTPARESIARLFVIAAIKWWAVRVYPELRAVFDRYNIVDESDVREALQKVGQYRATAAKQKVVAMS